MLRGPLTIWTAPAPRKVAPGRLAALRRAGMASLAAMALPSVAALAQTDAGTYRAVSELNIRAAPSIEAALVGVIPPSGRVTVFRCDAFGWCEVRFENLDGWAARQFLVRTGDLPTEAFTLRFTPPAEPADGVFEVVGRLTPGSPCATFRADDGTEYALLGNVRFHPAEAINVIGEVIATDACGTATALAVLHVRIAR